MDATRRRQRPAYVRLAHVLRLVLGASLGAAVSHAPLRAQGAPPSDSVRGTAPVSIDSLAARLARTEAALQLLRDQVATETASQVRMRSRVQLELSARIIVNSFRSVGSFAGPEAPVFAQSERARDPLNGSPGRNTLGLSMRQSLIGATVTMDSVLGGTLAADVELDFYARATDPAPPLFPEPRLRTARVFLTWPRTEVLAGMETPLVSDLNPISAAGVATPVFATAGNLWNWLPQLRVTRELWRSDARLPVSIALQGAVMSPYTNERHVANLGGPDAGSASGRPAFEARGRLRWGEEHDVVSAQGVLTTGGEIGVGTHVGWARVVGDSSMRSWASTIDARMALGHRLEVRGEAYRGRLLRGLGGGGIGQNFGTVGALADPGSPLTSTAGWMQLNAQLRPSLIAGAGCGTDRVEGATADRRRNTVCAAHAMWRPVQPLLLSVEYRDFRTRYAAGVARGGHLNFGLGIEL